MSGAVREVPPPSSTSSTRRQQKAQRRTSMLICFPRCLKISRTGDVVGGGNERQKVFRPSHLQRVGKALFLRDATIHTAESELCYQQSDSWSNWWCWREEKSFPLHCAFTLDFPIFRVQLGSSSRVVLFPTGRCFAVP